MNITFDPRVFDITSYTYDDQNRPFLKGFPAGTAHWSKRVDGTIHALHFTCPCGCGACGATPVYAGSNGWCWNGDLEKPTLTPSIKMLSPCGWHGYLTDGVFKRC
jgi:hypothetical protein